MFLVSKSNTNLVLFIIVLCPLFNLCTCCNIFSSETFETCGVFFEDFQPYTSEQGDFVHELLEHLHLNHKTSPQSVIIKTKLSKKEIHPDIFRSMKYDCYLFVHVNFGNQLLSTIPSIKNPLKSAYQKGLFVIFVKSNAREVLNIDNKTWKAQLARQYRIFVFRVTLTRRNQQNQHGTGRMFVLYKTYFYCPFCKPVLVQLTSSGTTNILSLQLTNFQKNWESSWAKHYKLWLPGHDENFCSHQNVMHLYKKIPRCRLPDMRIQMIVLASGINVTMKSYGSKYYDYTKLPQIFDNDRYHESREHHKLADPILKHYKYLSIVYCFNSGRVSVAETKMWTKYVPTDVWVLLGLRLISSSALYATHSSYNKSAIWGFENFVQWVNSLLKLVRLVLRQSWSHKWKVLGILELLLSFLISAYENSITVSVVVPLVPRPLINTMDLYKNNYTFVVQQYMFSPLYNWLSDEYNTVNHPRVVGVNTFWILSEWLEKYFLKQPNETKYAIVGDLSKHFDFRAVTFVKEKNDTCYHMYPTERAFYPELFYFSFASPLASSLHKGVSWLSALGFLHASQSAEEFRASLLALEYARPLMAKYNKEITYKDLKNRRLQESLITLGNLKPVLYVMLIIIVIANVSAVVEVYSLKIVLLMLPLRSRQRQ